MTFPDLSKLPRYQIELYADRLLALDKILQEIERDSNNPNKQKSETYIRPYKKRSPGKDRGKQKI